MTKAILHTDLAPQAIGPYSQAVWHGETLYLSGQIALEPQSGAFHNEDFATELKQILANIQGVLTAAGGDLSHLVKLTIYLIDFNDFPLLNALLTEALPQPYPARTTVAVAALPKNARVEIEAIAVIPRA